MNLNTLLKIVMHFHLDQPWGHEKVFQTFSLILFSNEEKETESSGYIWGMPQIYREEGGFFPK